ncbi:NAD(+)/NADH kinase [Planctomycetota bacterium]
MKKVAVIASTHRSEISQSLREFCDLLHGKAEIVLIDSDWKEDLSKLQADMVFVLGGDGTLLATARRMGSNQLPIVGINFGKLGFLAEFYFQDIANNINSILESSTPPSKHVILECTIEENGRTVQSFLAVNDIVVMRNNTPRMIELDISSRGKIVLKYQGDGLIIATPLGSSAHSMAAGGPLIFPELDVMVLTPVCPHTIASRPIVIPAPHGLELEVASQQEVTYTIDGQVFNNLESEQKIIIRKAPVQLLLITGRKVNYYDLLKQKLNWGTPPNYRAL